MRAESDVRKCRQGGYAHLTYGASLTDIGELCYLRLSKGWVLDRAITGTRFRDAASCYPFFVCDNWKALDSDLRCHEKKWISLTILTDPFGEYKMKDLKRTFPDCFRIFKNHFIIDLNQSPDRFVSDHHKRNVKKSRETVKVQFVAEPLKYLDEWISLYTILIGRHQISDVRVFSQRAFERQMRVPGFVMFRAVHDGRCAGMLLWYVKNRIGYYHLGAYSESGYQVNAAFSLFDFAIRYFADQKFHWLNLGSNAGTQDEPSDGLSRFKRGWSTGLRPVYLAGRIFDQDQYRNLTTGAGMFENFYFPAYRKGGCHESAG